MRHHDFLPRRRMKAQLTMRVSAIKPQMKTHPRTTVPRTFSCPQSSIKHLFTLSPFRKKRGASVSPRPGIVFLNLSILDLRPHQTFLSLDFSPHHRGLVLPLLTLIQASFRPLVPARRVVVVRGTFSLSTLYARSDVISLNDSDLVALCCRTIAPARQPSTPADASCEEPGYPH